MAPADLVDARRAEGRRVGEKTVDERAHRERARMPTARDDSAVERLSGGRRIDVKGLRIELARKADDLFLVNGMMPNFASPPDDGVLKILFQSWSPPSAIGVRRGFGMPVTCTFGVGAGFGVNVATGWAGGVYDASGVMLTSGSGIIATLSVREAES